MFWRTKKKLLLTICVIGSPLILSAQNRLDSLQHLNEVVVTARSFQEIIPSQRLSGIQLERLTSHTVADALRYFAGIQIKDYGGIGGLKTVDVRNMGTHHVGVFYDGIQLGNAQNGIIDLGKFSLDDMDELSLYNGQKSEIFQSARDFASASTIYLRTKKPKFATNTHTNQLVRYKAGTIQLINPSFRWEQKLNDKLSMSLSSEYIKSDGKYKFRYKRLNVDKTVAYDTTAIRKNSDIEALRVETGLYGTVNGGYWESKLYYYDSERGAPGAIVENKFYDGHRQADRNFFAQSAFNKDITDRYKFQIKGKYAFDYMHYMSRDSTQILGEHVTLDAQFDNEYYQQEVYLSAVNKYSITPKWDIALATDFQWNKLNATLRGVNTPFSYPTRYTTLVSLASSLDLGKLKLLANLVGSFVQERVRNNAQPPNKEVLTPTIFIGYQPFKRYDLHLRFFAKRIFRMPTFNDLYYSQIGYSALKPEYTNQYNIGFNYTKTVTHSFVNGFSLQADAYYMNIRDKIIAAPTGNLFRWMMSNMGKVEGKGIDVAAGVRMRLGQVTTSTNLVYSYSESTDYTKVNGLKLSSYGNQIPYTPWHSGSVIMNGIYQGWAVNYSFVYVGERYNGGVNNIPKNLVQPWYTHDISFQKEVMYKTYRIKGSVEVNNALNQHYEVIYNYPMPGRNFRFIISIEL